MVPFPFSLKHFFQHFFQSRFAKNEFSFFLKFSFSKNVIIQLSFLKDIINGYRILDHRFFSFSTWKMFHCFLTSLISDEKPSIIQIIISLIIMYSFSLSGHEQFSFIFVFTQLIMMCPRVAIFELILFRVYEHLAFVNLYIF